MDRVNSSNEEQKQDTPKIKLEIAETDHNPTLSKDERPQTYIDEKFVKGANTPESGISKFECSSCDNIFSDETNLKNHVDEHHQENNNRESTVSSSRTKLNYKCEHKNCGKSFKTKFMLARHDMLHSGMKPFQCEVCTKSFRRKEHLVVHLSSHNGDLPFKCTHQGCDKAYNRKDRLKIHLQTHSPNSEGKEMIYCAYPNCNSKFPLKHLYKNHVRRHELGKRYRCTFDQCDAAFYDKNDLNRHIVVHTKERFLCGYNGCEKTYARKDLRAVHQKAAHKIIQSSKGCHQDEYTPTVVKIENALQCSICEETFSEENEFEEHVKCCGKYSTFEFIKVEDIGTDDSFNV